MHNKSVAEASRARAFFPVEESEALAPNRAARPHAPATVRVLRSLFWNVHDLNVHYGRQTVLHGVSMQIEAGKVTAIIGPSGCGKSSFLYTLNRLSLMIPGCRVTGQIRLQSTDVLSPGIDEVALRRKVGFIFQKPNPFPMSIYRNLELPLREHGIRDRATIDESIESALRAVGLWTEVKDRLSKPALLLSGGQQQRLCIARALVLKPEALVMDEPCSALDPIASGVVEQLICSFRNKYTIVIVTHNLRQARRLGDDVAVFWTQEGVGRLIEHGPAEQIFGAPREELTQRYVAGAIG